MIAERVFHWAGETPDKAAVVYDGRPISYLAFARLIAMARGYFLRRGWAGEGVAVLAVRDLMDFWILSLALRGLGLTTVTVGSADGLASLGLPDVRGAVTSPSEDWPGLAERCAAEGFELLSVSLSDEAPLDPAAGPSYPPGGHILQTSGTTGEFKKVLMDPAFETAYLRRRRLVSKVDQDTIAAMFSFPAGTGLGYKAPANVWTVGGTVVIQQRGDISETLRHPGLTHASLVPTMLAVLLAAPEGAFPFNPTLDLGVTGASITQGQIDQIKTRIAGRVSSALGATESNAIASTYLDSPEDARWHVLVPSSEVQIVGEDGRSVPTGQVGQLRVDTRDAFTSYLHDEEATQTFFKDGFFYTGDLAVARADGRIALRGRVTEVINVLGRKVSPAPIEERLREALVVTGVCLFSMQDAAGEEEIHVVIEAGAPIDLAQLRPVLQRELDGFPRARVRYVPTLPRNAMGKVLRAAVRALVTG